MGITSSENRTDKPHYAAFFDLDHTLISENSSKLLIRLAYERELITPGTILKALWLMFLFKFNLRDTEKIIAGMVKWLSGIPLSLIDNLAREVFDKYLITLISDDARSALRMHKQKKAHLVILSSALHPLCSAVAVHLKMDHVICTELEIQGSVYSGKPSGRLCFKDEKMIRLRKYCENINSSPEDAWYYGDSIADLPALEAVGHPVCIDPDRRLRKKALKRGWPVYSWNSS